MSIVEKTPQPNDNPQSFVLTSNTGGDFSSTRAVTPLRTLQWSLRLTNPLGVKDIASTNITVNQPAGPLTDGSTSVSITDNSVDQRRKFAHAVQTPNEVVRVAGNVNLDLSGLDGTVVAPNVQIIGDRKDNPAGPLLFTTTEPSNLLIFPPSTSGSHERITGIRLRGGASTDPFANLGNHDSNAIQIQKPDVQVDHNEIYLWRGAGVDVLDCDDCATARNLLNIYNAATVWIHDNYIHHNQHPTSEFFGGHGAGYGVAVRHGGYALIEKNVFDYNRHSITAGGQSGTGYLFYRNLILPNGGVNSRVSSTHAIDVHGSNADDNYESGQAGEYFDVEYNTVWNKNGSGLKLRGTPTDKMEVRHNSFVHDDLWGSTLESPPALVQNETGLQQSDNLVQAAIGGDARTTCDFDGDGTNDPFHATGVTWWYQSSRLAGRYVYLNQSNATGTAVQLSDVNDDGLCDVTANGSVFTLKPDVVAGDVSMDGTTDIALVTHATNSIPVARSNGDGTFTITDAVSGDFAGWARAPGVKVINGDFNNDGRTDIALLPGPNTSWWYTIPVAFSNGDGTFTITNTPSPEFVELAKPGADVLY